MIFILVNVSKDSKMDKLLYSETENLKSKVIRKLLWFSLIKILRFLSKTTKQTTNNYDSYRFIKASIHDYCYSLCHSLQFYARYRFDENALQNHFRIQENYFTGAPRAIDRQAILLWLILTNYISFLGVVHIIYLLRYCFPELKASK